MYRRKFLFGGIAALVTSAMAQRAEAFHEPLLDFEDPEFYDPEFEEYVRRRRQRRRDRMQRELALKRKKPGSKSKTGKIKKPQRPAYEGRKIVGYFTFEKAGTIIVKTKERALYQVMDGGKAKRYLVAVGREGFGWRGTARVGMKRVNPTWTPPAEMIEREPKYEKWADGMPGGIPENPLGVRALYLYKGNKDTLFRIHGTNNPSSIGTAASSGCIRMLNKEVVELFENTPIGTKVIVS